MKKYIEYSALFGCMLTFAAFAACASDGKDRYADSPKNDIIITQPDSADGGDSDDLPETPEMPNAPQLPETPQLPSAPQAPDDGQTSIRPQAPPQPEKPTAEYVRVDVNGLNVRSGPATSFPSLGVVESGVLLKPISIENCWYRIEYRNRTAYVSARPDYTSEIAFDIGNIDGNVESVVEEGIRVLGTEYVYGATRYHDGKGRLIGGFTTDAFDCSSLMQYIFYKGSGRLLGVTSRAQSVQGEFIQKSQIKRGDLLFFTNASRKNNTGLERVGHVALYLGNNYILHTASDYAKIEQISPARWNYYISARRILS